MPSVAQRVAALDPVKVAVALAAAVFVFGLFGSMDALRRPVMWLFNLNTEGNAPALFSMAQLVAAGAVAILAGRQARTARVPWMAFGVFLILLGIDEGISVHEYVTERTVTSWQVLFSPLYLAGAVAALAVVWQRRTVPELAGLLLLGGGAWAISQGIELWQWDDGRLELPYWTIVPEEVLEMSGAACFLVAALLDLRTSLGLPAPALPAWLPRQADA